MMSRYGLGLFLAIGIFAFASLAPLKSLERGGAFGNAINPLSARLMAGAPAHPYAARIEKATYNGWDVTRLTNGLISLYVAPEIGGRAIQLELGSQGLFFVNKSLAGKSLPPAENDVKSGWADYGGDKVWPAPEGWSSDAKWPGVPYYILDGSAFAFSIVKDTPAEVSVRVTSPKDARTGIQFERTYHVFAGTTRVTVDQVMKNVSPRRIRWSIWDAVQYDAADASAPSKPNPALDMYIPINAQSKFARGYDVVYGDARNPSYQVGDDGRILRVHYDYRAGKVLADSSSGWFAVVNGQKNTGCVETFQFFSAMEYPANASVEAANEGPGTISRGPFFQTLPDDPAKTPYFLEAGVLSPVKALDPDEQYEFTVHWSPTSVTNPVVDAVWAGVVSRPLSAVVRGSQITLDGVFGVFVPGSLVANFYSPVGEITGEQTLQPVDPRRVVRLGKTIDLPANSYRVSVFVRDRQGENAGYLGNVIMKTNGE